MSGTENILLLASAPALRAPHRGAPSCGARREELCQRLNRRDRILTQGQDDPLLIVSFERLYIAGCLGLRERAKAKWFSRNAEIGNHPIDEL